MTDIERVHSRLLLHVGGSLDQVPSQRKGFAPVEKYTGRHVHEK